MTLIKIRKKFSVGIYARLSVDSHSSKNDSIETQIMMAKEYLNLHQELQLYQCYSDLGKSGMHFERTGFQQLMQDVRSHRVDCIVVKDFSRFGRDYIETGNYIEKVFPFMGVRFISVIDQYDSFVSDSSDTKLTMNLKNLVNEMYAKDIANRVKIAKRVKQEQGNYTGGVAPYGYCASYHQGRKVLVPEPITSEIVRQIFSLFDKNCSQTNIVRYLFHQKIHRPSERHKFGHIYQENEEPLKQWAKATIKAMLKNPVYIGQLRHNGELTVQNADESKQMESHEPLIEQNLFYRIATKFEQQTEKYSSQLKKGNLCPSIIDLNRQKGKNKSNNNSRFMDLLKALFDQEFQANLNVRKLIEWGVKKAEAFEQIKKRLVSDIVTKEAEVQMDMSNKYLAYYEGRLSKAGFSKQMAVLDGQLDDLVTKKATLQRQFTLRKQIFFKIPELLQQRDEQFLLFLTDEIRVCSEKKLEISLSYGSLKC
jgi:DNA invertase Pin-like site-specific DNA recombinase